VLFLGLTIGLGLVFLGIKAVEYSHKFDTPGSGSELPLRVGRDPQHAQLFFSLYFVMTGLHALAHGGWGSAHEPCCSCGLKGRFTRAYHTPVEVSGLYWHFVDIVWIFLFPLLYPDRPHGPVVH